MWCEGRHLGTDMEMNCGIQIAFKAMKWMIRGLKSEPELLKKELQTRRVGNLVRGKNRNPGAEKGR